MVTTTRVLVLTLVAATCFSTAGCSGANESPTGGAGGSSTTSGVGNTTAGSGTSAAGSGTSAAGSGTSAAGSGTSAAGSGTSAAGSGTVGNGGAATAGASSVSTAGAASGDFSPLCAGLTTAAAAAPTKGGACTEADPQLCYKTCGPQSSGFKSETCTAGTYAEQSGCTFPPDLDATCFKIPATQDASCPATPPQASSDCTVAPCTLCNGGGGPTGTYLDSKGTAKAGYCVCPAAGASGSRKWSCGSTDAWPCPGAKGC